MNISLRDAIIQRMKGKSSEEMREVIDDSVDGDERALPGLGVLFEMIWKNIDEEQQNLLVATLEGQLSS